MCNRYVLKQTLINRNRREYRNLKLARFSVESVFHENIPRDFFQLVKSTIISHGSTIISNGDTNFGPNFSNTSCRLLYHTYQHNVSNFTNLGVDC